MSISLRDGLERRRWNNFTWSRNLSHPKVIFDVALICSIPLFQALINSSWMFNSYDWLDPWYYHGYGLSYLWPDFHNDYYKAARLPWIWLEFLVRNFFSPTAASWLLQISLLAAGSSFLYAAFSRLVGRSSAFIAAAFFASNYFAHASGGADYQNTLAGPLFAMSWWMTIRSAQDGYRPLGLFLTGAAFAATVHTNIVFVNLAPILIAQYVFCYRERFGRIPSILPTAMLALFGAIALTAFMGLVNWLVGRDFFFFMKIFNLASSFVKDSSQQKAWWNPWTTGWYWTAVHLGQFTGGMILAVAVYACVALRKSEATTKERNAVVLAIGFLYAWILWLCWQTAGQTALDWGYFAYPIVLPLNGAIAASAAIWLRLPEVGTKAVLWKLATLALFIAPILIPQPLLALWKHNTTFLFSAAFFALALGAAILAGRRILGGLVFVAALSYGLALSYPWINIFMPSSCQIGHHITTIVDNSHRYLRQRGYTFSSVFLWGDMNEDIPAGAGCVGTQSVVKLKYMASAIRATGFSFLADGVMDQVDIPAERIAAVAEGKHLIGYVTNDRSRVEKLAAAFQALGRRTSIIDPKDFESGPIRVQIYLLQIST
ncbi:hypothetical protein [Tardiphaga sp. 841_E9_N1_2]|jgi:hypothetical protein|uniref:hypothetical protein n=1 Tax=Tardiphaga sp. 841_E9_N1_2 TaxID=3240762 RepID=UPI003F2819AA